MMSHTLLLNVSFPANLREFLLAIFEVVNFEFVDVSAVTAYLMNFTVIEKIGIFFTQADIISNNFV